MVNPLAITGMACRLPGALGLDALFAQLLSRRDAFVDLPIERWDPAAHAVELPVGVRLDGTRLRGALLSDFSVDWRAVNLPPMQAARMHRMERVALSTMCAALLDAGLSPSAAAPGGVNERARVILAASNLGADPATDLSRRVRRFELAAQVSAALADHLPDERGRLDALIDRRFDEVAPPLELDSIGTSASLIAGRVANLFDLRGGHLVIDAGMASSLAAIERACCALWLGECDLVLVCAVSPLLMPASVLGFAHRGLLGQGDPRPFCGPDGGTILGEGCAAVVLRRLEDVAAGGAVGEAPGRCYAAIAGIGAAGQGREQPGPAVSRPAQEAALLALSQACCPSAALQFIESRACGHGPTDQAEAAGLTSALSGAAAPVWLTSTVPNVGFLQGAAGMVALVKAALSLSRRTLPAPPLSAGGVGNLRGLAIPQAPIPLPADAWAGVSDAGLGPVAYHAVLTTPAVAAAQAARAAAGAATGASPVTPPTLTPPTTRRPVRLTQVVRPAPGAAAPLPAAPGLVNGAGADAMAIVGCGLIAPQADDVPTFWHNILSRVDAIGDLPRTRWDVDQLCGSGKDPGVFLKTRLAGVVTMPPFDPGRFGIPPALLHTLDPAVILSLLSSEQAIADAGYAPGRWDPRRVRVILGQLPLRAAEVAAERRVLFAGHLRLAETVLREAGVRSAALSQIVKQARARFDRDSAPLSSETLLGFTGLNCAARVAAAYDFRGGAVATDAACASSLAAVVLARESLLSGAADVVLAGGVAYNLFPEYYLILGLLGFLSPRGAPSFTQESDGFVPGEGAGVVVLKRLGDALAARDRIYAVVRGTGLASDGRGRSIFAPSSAGQQRAIRAALDAAGVPATAIDLVEAHGTGTRLSDQTEAATYAEVYGERDPGTPLSVSTLKGQIGHLSAAAGIMGLIKTALSVREGVLPPGASDLPPAADLPFGKLPLELCTEPRPWVVGPERPRRAGVSAFGLGGVNCHLILEEAAPLPADRRVRPVDSRPAPLPPRGPMADRFALELVPLSLPDRPASFSFAGRQVLLVPDRGGAAAALAARLQAHGAEVHLLGLPPADGGLSAADERRALEAALSPHVSRPISVVLDLSPLDDTALSRASGPLTGSLAAATFAAALQQRSARTFAVLRAFYERLGQGGCYAAVTALGGLGILSAEGTDPLGALWVGVAKGLKQEIPGLLAKAIDFMPAAAPDVVADCVMRELLDGNDRMEVAYLGRRMGVNLVRQNFNQRDPVVRALRPGEVFLFSGGGRGVAFECACALARSGAVVVVCGRTPVADPAAPWLDLSDDEFRDFRVAEMQRRHAADPRLTPAAFNEQMEPILRQRELHRNLQRVRRFDLPIHYEVCDITDTAQVEAVAARVRERFGRIDGVAHSAMVEWSRSLPRKTQRMVDRTLATKVQGLLNLLLATQTDPLRHLLCFGSGAGRFGNAGQVDYCGANSLMAALLQHWERHHGRGLRPVTIDWTAWQGTGAAVANPEIEALVRRTGVTSIAPAEGTYWFLSELALGVQPEVVIFEERMLHHLHFLGQRADGVGGAAQAGDRAGRGAACDDSWLLFDDRGAPLVPGAWPMVDHVIDRGPGRVQIERRMEVVRDRFLEQHRLYGTPIVPATFGCEILAEAASLAAPGWVLVRAEDIHIGVPVKLHREEPILLRASAQVTEEDRDRRVVMAETRSHLFLRGRVVQADRLHHRGKFVFARALPPPDRVEIPEGSGVVQARSFFHMAKDPIRLGPLFCRAEWLQITSQEVTGSVRAPRQRDVLRDSSYPLFQIDPLLMDTAFQIAANWDGHHHAFVSLPLALGAVTLHRPRERGEGARVHARVRKVLDPDVFYDVVVAGDNGDLLMRLHGVHLRRIGRIA